MSGFWTTELMKERLPDLIDPYDVSRVVNCSYELAMGPEAFITGRETHTKKSLKNNEQIRIPPGQFAHLLTEEVIRIPDDALGLISVRSRYKFWGLVNVSGFHVDPGYRGRLIFAVYNAGTNDIAISRGAQVFLLWYTFLTGSTKDGYEGSRKELQHLSDEDTMRLYGQVATPQSLADRMGSLEDELTRRMNKLDADLSVRIEGVERRLSGRWLLTVGLIGAIVGAFVTNLSEVINFVQGVLQGQ